MKSKKKTLLCLTFPQGFFKSSLPLTLHFKLFSKHAHHPSSTHARTIISLHSPLPSEPCTVSFNPNISIRFSFISEDNWANLYRLNIFITKMGLPCTSWALSNVTSFFCIVSTSASAVPLLTDSLYEKQKKHQALASIIKWFITQVWVFYRKTDNSRVFSIRNYIRDTSEIFSISSLVKISLVSFLCFLSIFFLFSNYSYLSNKNENYTLVWTYELYLLVGKKFHLFALTFQNLHKIFFFWFNFERKWSFYVISAWLEPVSSLYYI